MADLSVIDESAFQDWIVEQRWFGSKAREVKFLVSTAKAQWRQNGVWIETTTPPIELHEVVAIDL